MGWSEVTEIPTKVSYVTVLYIKKKKGKKNQKLSTKKVFITGNMQTLHFLSVQLVVSVLLGFEFASVVALCAGTKSMRKHVF